MVQYIRKIKDLLVTDGIMWSTTEEREEIIADRLGTLLPHIRVYECALLIFRKDLLI